MSPPYAPSINLPSNLCKHLIELEWNGVFRDFGQRTYNYESNLYSGEAKLENKQIKEIE